LLAAAAFWSARFTAAGFFPGLGLQLPFSRGAFPATGSKPGQHRELCFASEDLEEDEEVFDDEDFSVDVFFVVIVSRTAVPSDSMPRHSQEMSRFNLVTTQPTAFSGRTK